ncbi:MAG: UDP-3-O-(3-hydroxymyristoyl)glucosamine N-acyltransferase, partial [Planctomycetia bacterium]|nr:UDP-3-O-(3-hydroxymyristoyl)glucosamine N-acyltransferase [Planctomycetia bacterium]
MATSLAELARLTGGRLIGDPTVMIEGAAPLGVATAHQITFIDSQLRERQLSGSPAAAVVVPAALAPASHPAIQVDNVHAAFATIVRHFRPARTAPRIQVSPAAQVSPQAVLAENVDVHAGAIIGDDVTVGAGSTIHANVSIMAGSRIGRDVTIFPGAVLYENTIVGDRAILHAGAVLGAYGFGYDSSSGRHILSAQLGYVEIGADVEIGAATTIDRGTYGPTSIGEGTKIDNQVMIAHNCRIGRHNMICSQVGVAGSTTTGDYVVMAGQVGVRDHVHIGARAILGAKAGVSHDVPDGVCMIGIPATPEREQKLKQAALAKLPEMRKEMRRLQRLV